MVNIAARAASPPLCRGKQVVLCISRSLDCFSFLALLRLCSQLFHLKKWDILGLESRSQKNSRLLILAMNPKSAKSMSTLTL